MERRSTFRFRLPWSSQPEPEPAASKPSNRPTRQVTRSRTTSQPSSSTRPKTRPSSSPTTENSTPPAAISGKPSSPAQPAAGTQGHNEVSASTTTQPPRSPQPQPQNSAETKTTSQSTTTSTSTLPETITTPPQPSAESKAPIQSTTNTSPLPESSQVPYQPSAENKDPIQSSTANTNAPASPKSETQRPQSSPPGVAPSRTESQPLIPSQEEQGITSQSASPSDVATKYNLSPSTPQSREMSPKSSPPSNVPQVLSTDQLTPKEASLVSQTSSEGQLKDQIISQPTTPPKQSEESSETSSKPDEKLPSISEKEPIPTTVWPQPEQVELLKKEAISDTLTEPNQPSELSEVSSDRGTTEGPSKISDYSRIDNEPKTSRPLETNIPESKEVKEVVQEIGGFLTSKEQPDTVFQSKQVSSDNDQIRVNHVSNGKQTRTISAEQDIPLNKEVKDHISKFIHRMAIGDNKQNLEEGPVSVITLAGDNRGASMQLGSNSSKKGRAVYLHRGYKLNADDETTDTEGRQPNDARTMKEQGLEAYMNCNVQGLNNSITFDSSIEAKNPGIHMSFPRIPSETTRSSEGTVLVEAHKAECNVTRAQKHTYEPTNRRRCLEGLFFEPSDSDSDNYEKPQRHGCPVGYMEKRGNDIDIL